MTVTQHPAFKPQTQAVLDWLRGGATLTDREADRLFKVRRLAARIREIRAVYGDDVIQTTYETRGAVRYARYSWAGTGDHQLSLMGALE